MRFAWTIGFIILLTGAATSLEPPDEQGTTRRPSSEAGPPLVDSPGSQVRPTGPESMTPGSIVERGVQDTKEEERNATEPPGLLDIFVPWMNLVRITREEDRQERKETATLERKEPSRINQSDGGEGGARVERESKDEKGGGKVEDLEGAEQGLGIGYFYWNPWPFYAGPRPWPPYRRRYYDRYPRYPPIFTG